MSGRLLREVITDILSNEYTQVGSERRRVVDRIMAAIEAHPSQPSDDTGTWNTDRPDEAGWVRRIAKECAFRSICPGGHGDADEIERAINHVLKRVLEAADPGCAPTCMHAECKGARDAVNRVRSLLKPEGTSPKEPTT